MNPSQPTPKANPTLVRDVKPPSSINAEIVNDIPVKNPLGPDSSRQQPVNNSGSKFMTPVVIEPAQSTEDKELDHILQDVNSSVKRSENSIEARFEHLSGVRKKVAVKKANLNQAHHGSPPIMATFVAGLVALMLTIGAVLALR